MMKPMERWLSSNRWATRPAVRASSGMPFIALAGQPASSMSAGIAPDTLIGSGFVRLDQLPLWLIVTLVCTLVIFLTELTSNTAVTTALLPVLGAAAIALGIDPLKLVVPAAIVASLAFMLPVATPPNAIVFGSGRITVPQMARTGFGLNIIGIVVVTLATLLLGDFIVDLG